MTTLVWATWVVAMAGTAVPLLLRVTGLDQRWLPAIRWSSLGMVPPVTATALFVVVDIVEDPTGFSPPPPFLLAVTPVVLAGLLALLVWPPRTRTASHALGLELSLLTVNVERDTPHAGAIAHVVAAADADVVVVQEWTPATATAWKEAGIVDRYPHVIDDADPGYFGSAVLSRFPLSYSGPTTIGEDRAVVAGLLAGGHDVCLAVVHLRAPIHRRDVAAHLAGFVHLGEVAAAAQAAGRPVVLAGDWNAVLTQEPMRRLMRGHDLDDAHRRAARIRPRTWPVGHGVLPPFLCVDHLLVGRDVDVLDVSELDVPGTDHRAVLAHLQLP